MNFRCRWLPCLAATLLACDATAAVSVTGRVHERDSDRAIAGVLVSNGRDLVRSDEDGRYRLTVEPGQNVFVVKPPACSLPIGDDGLPLFWHPPPDPGAPGHVADLDFELRCGAPPPEGPFEVLVFADPQTATAVDVGYYRRDLIEPLLAQGIPASVRLGVTLGDVVNDELSLYPSLIEQTARLRRPWLHVAGNHDLDFDAGHDRDSLATFRRHFGPDTFAYEEGALRMLLLDNVIYRPGRSPAYIGGLREDQFEFVENYLATVPADALLVLAMHIPLFDSDARPVFRPEDRARLFALLARVDRPLVLSGHRHALQHHLHTAADGWSGPAPLHEFNVGAVNGGYWGGVKGEAGIPDSIMADGTPNGHAVLTVRPDAGYALRWHPARDPDTAIALHAPNVLRQGSYPGVYLHANVFMAFADDRVEYRVGDADWQPMSRVLTPDPRVLAINAADNAATALRGYDRTPEAVPSSHLWRGRLPTGLPVGEHRIQVRVFDRWRGELRAQTRYRLEAATP